MSEGANDRAATAADDRAAIAADEMAATAADDSAATSADVAELVADRTATGSWVLDQTRSSVGFAVKHFWGAVTVRGSIGDVSGAAEVAEDGTITGQLIINARSLTTKNKQRDNHLRSADFFDAERHPNMIVTVTAAKPAGPAALACEGTIEAAGHVRPVQFRARVQDPSATSVVLRAELTLDRTEFDMTWSPLGVAARQAQGAVVARFVRA
jgi:polyisoprenoid-binding protein YceI